MTTVEMSIDFLAISVIFLSISIILLMNKIDEKQYVVNIPQNEKHSKETENNAIIKDSGVKTTKKQFKIIKRTPQESRDLIRKKEARRENLKEY